MPNVATMVLNVKAECKPVTNIDGIIKRWLEQGQKVITSKGSFPFLRQYRYTISTTSGTEYYALSNLVDTSKIIHFYNESSPRYLSYASEANYRMYDPGSASTGSSYLYRLLGYSPVKLQPTSASVLTFVSTSVADTTQKVTINGLNSSSTYIVETVTLTGTSSVASTTSFTKVLALSKDSTTTGSVTCTSNSAAVTNVILPPSELDISHPIVGLSPDPSSTETIYYDFYSILPRINSDTDVSLLPSKYHDVPELYAKSRCFRHLNNGPAADTAFQEFLARIEDMKGDSKEPLGLWNVQGVVGAGHLSEGTMGSGFPRGW